MKKLDLANTGADVAGGIASAKIGLAVAGPPGAIAGAIIAPVLASVAKDIAARFLSPREKMRLDNATTYIKDGIDENLSAGRHVRQDDFFVGSANYSSNAVEILEGVLIKCKAQYQEKKVRLIANIFKNVAFNENISAQTAYHVLTLADDLTYQNLCLLAYFGNKSGFANFSPYSTSLSSARYSDPVPDWLTNNETWEVYRDMISLYREALLKDSSGSSHLMADTLTLEKTVLDTRGQSLFDLMELYEIPQEDVLSVVRPVGGLKST